MVRLAGIYVPQDSAFPKHFQGIGIRIEDEVLVGKDHPTVLSVAAPKEVSCDFDVLFRSARSSARVDCGRRGRMPGRARL